MREESWFAAAVSPDSSGFPLELSARSRAAIRSEVRVAKASRSTQYDQPSHPMIPTRKAPTQAKTMTIFLRGDFLFDEIIFSASATASSYSREATTSSSPIPSMPSRPSSPSMPSMIGISSSGNPSKGSSAFSSVFWGSLIFNIESKT